MCNKSKLQFATKQNFNLQPIKTSNCKQSKVRFATNQNFNLQSIKSITTNNNKNHLPLTTCSFFFFCFFILFLSSPISKPCGLPRFPPIGGPAAFLISLFGLLLGLICLFPDVFFPFGFPIAPLSSDISNPCIVIYGYPFVFCLYSSQICKRHK